MKLEIFNLLILLKQMNFVMFLTYVLSSPDNQLTAQKIFVSISLSNILRMPMSMLPFLIVATAQVFPDQINNESLFVCFLCGLSCIYFILHNLLK